MLLIGLSIRRPKGATVEDHKFDVFLAATGATNESYFQTGC